MGYSLQSFIIQDKVFYELVSEKGSIFNLIKEIDEDDFSFLNEYKDEKYNPLVSKCSEYLGKYCKLNRKRLKHELNDISYSLVLILIILHYEQHTEKYSYKDLRSKIEVFNDYKNINLKDFFLEDWFRIYSSIQDYSLSVKEYELIKERKDISFMTYTNFGYIDYTKNLILSLEQCNFPLQLIVYCVDKKSYDILKEFNDNVILKLLNDKDNQNEAFVKLYKEGWDKMMISKMKAIHKELNNSDYVFYTDSDIVFENNYCIQYLLDNLYDNDLLAQNNFNHEFCAGFMFIKSNDVTKDIFDTTNIDMDNFKCDQPYINSKKDRMNYRVLPINLFPSGLVYYQFNIKSPFIIHFNFIVGAEKRKKLVKYSKWYLNDNIQYKFFNTEITDDSFILLCVLKDEIILIDYFIKYYESIGVTHFIIIDNNSSDGSFEYLLDKNNTNMILYQNKASFKESNFGSEWIQKELHKYCKDKWCLTIDADELLRIKEINLNELRQKMILNNSNVLLTMLLDMYSLEEPSYKQGDNFLDYCPYYDKFNVDYYNIKGDITNIDNNTQIQGGVRKRLFKTDCVLTKRNFFKYDFYDKYVLDGGYHDLKEIHKQSCNGLNFYQDINLIFHFKFIKPNLKAQFNIKISNNNLLNKGEIENESFDAWCEEIKSYSEHWKEYDNFKRGPYTTKYNGVIDFFTERVNPIYISKCIYICIFNNSNYVKMFYLLLESIYIFGNLDGNTDILIYTSTPFMNMIRKNHLFSDKIKFEINDNYNTIEKACKSRLDLFKLHSVKRYNKILYLDTDILINDDINKVFEVLKEDILYVLEEGNIDSDTDFWGKTLFGNEIDNYNDKSAFTSGILLFNNCDKIKDLFDMINKDIINRPYDFECHDQPYIIYNTFKNNLYDNQILKTYAANNDKNNNSKKVIYHFPGGPGVYQHKIVNMNIFRNSIMDIRFRRINHTINIEQDIWTCSSKMRDDIAGFFISKPYFKIAEIGAYKGYSTKVLSKIFSKVYAIDNNIKWMNLNKNYNEKVSNIEYVLLDIYKDSWEILPDDIEVVFIDADHSYNCCKSDIINSIKRFKDLQYIIFDDYGVWDGVKNIIEELIKKNILIFETFIGINDVPGPTCIVENTNEGVICSINKGSDFKSIF